MEHQPRWPVDLCDELGENVWPFFPEAPDIGVETIKTAGLEAELTHARRRDPEDRPHGHRALLSG